MLLVSYHLPVEGTIVVAAPTAESAKTKVLELFKNRTNVEIADIVDLEDPPTINEEPSATNVIPFNKKKED